MYPTSSADLSLFFIHDLASRKYLLSTLSMNSLESHQIEGKCHDCFKILLEFRPGFGIGNSFYGNIDIGVFGRILRPYYGPPLYNPLWIISVDNQADRFIRLLVRRFPQISSPFLCLCNPFLVVFPRLFNIEGFGVHD